MKNTRSNEKNIDNFEIKQSGYSNVTELNFGKGLGDASDDFSFGTQTINGYLVNPNFYLGFVVGVDKYKNATFIPLFADIRINFNFVSMCLIY